MSVSAKPWSIVSVVSLAALVSTALLLPQSFQLTALSDLIQCVLLIAGLASLVPLALKAHGRMRLFWFLMSLGAAFWLSNQLLWTYFEVWLRQDVPELFVGDIVVFLHIVPFMAAIALRPHVPRDDYASRLGRLDFALLMVWWIYLYLLIVIPWQYVVPNVATYNHNLNSLYLTEKIALQAALLVAWLGSSGRWKIFYANLFGASLAYASASYVANWAISRNVYYSGSLYDVPLAASMIWISLLAGWARGRELDPVASKTSTAYGVWVARLSMIAVFSLPLFAAWTLWDAAVPARILSYRLILTLGAALVMGAMVFERQRLLDRELKQLLNHSRDSFANLKQLQAQIIESEKLASIGQLVGGAAHELNNPITAMLGYSDMLLATSLGSEQHALAVKIGRHVRRTRGLVASLLSFAKQGPPMLVPLDINILARTALNLCQPQRQASKIETHTRLQPDLPLVLGDSNQLLQVLSHIIADAVESMDQQGVGSLTVTTQWHADTVVCAISVHELFAGESEKVEATSQFEDSPGALGVNTWQRILREHQGCLNCLKQENGDTVMRIELPAMAATESHAVTRPPMAALLQSPPFA